MNEIKNKIRRLRFVLNHDFFTFENIVLIIAIVLCLVWTFQSIRAMTRNWELSEKLAIEKRSLELIKVEVETMELENEYLRSDEYQELVARKQLDRKLEGENLVIMPENSEAAKNKYNDSIREIANSENPNFKKWMMFLFPGY